MNRAMTRLSPSRPPPQGRHWSTVVVGSGATYFLIVFADGFVLGVVRTVSLVPRIGVRWAQLLEMPVMLAVIYWAARWVTQRVRLDKLTPLATAQRSEAFTSSTIASV